MSKYLGMAILSTVKPVKLVDLYRSQAKTAREAALKDERNAKEMKEKYKRATGELRKNVDSSIAFYEMRARDARKEEKKYMAELKDAMAQDKKRAKENTEGVKHLTTSTKDGGNWVTIGGRPVFIKKK